MDRQRDRKSTKTLSVCCYSGPWEDILCITHTDTHQTSHCGLQSGGERVCVHVLAFMCMCVFVILCILIEPVPPRKNA